MRAGLEGESGSVRLRGCNLMVQFLMIVGVLSFLLFLARPLTAQERGNAEVVSVSKLAPSTSPHRYELRKDPECRSTPKQLSCVKVVDIYDGDTVFIDLPGIPPVFGNRIGVRIQGIDTAEIRSKSICEKQKAKEAKSFLVSLLKGAKRVDVMNVRRDKYFRLLGDLVVDGSSVSEKLITKKLAYPYIGDAKPQRDWCQ